MVSVLHSSMQTYMRIVLQMGTVLLYICYREIEVANDGPLKAKPWGLELSEELESDMHNQFPSSNLFYGPIYLNRLLLITFSIT